MLNLHYIVLDSIPYGFYKLDFKKFYTRSTAGTIYRYLFTMRSVRFYARNSTYTCEKPDTSAGSYAKSRGFSGIL